MSTVSHLAVSEISSTFTIKAPTYSAAVGIEYQLSDNAVDSFAADGGAGGGVICPVLGVFALGGQPSHGR